MVGTFASQEPGWDSSSPALACTSASVLPAGNTGVRLLNRQSLSNDSSGLARGNISSLPQEVRGLDVVVLLNLIESNAPFTPQCTLDCGIFHDAIIVRHDTGSPSHGGSIWQSGLELPR